MTAVHSVPDGVGEQHTAEPFSLRPGDRVKREGGLATPGVLTGADADPHQPEDTEQRVGGEVHGADARAGQ